MSQWPYKPDKETLLTTALTLGLRAAWRTWRKRRRRRKERKARRRDGPDSDSRDGSSER